MPRIPPRFESDEGRKAGYYKEAGKRRKIASYFEPLVIEDIQKILRSLGFSVGKPMRHAQKVGRNAPDYEKGAPDYELEINSRSKLMEIKIKRYVYRKKNAWYFDNYIYEQIKAHCDHYNYDFKDVILVFAYNEKLYYELEREFNPKSWQYYVISFDKIDEDIRTGKYEKYAAGYVKDKNVFSYLIPVSDTLLIQNAKNLFRG
jgi:hypothetical protein